jgi:hypothetical protein
LAPTVKAEPEPKNINFVILLLLGIEYVDFTIILIPDA